MGAQIIQFIPRPNPKREAQQAIEAMFQATWAAFFAWAGLIDMDLYAKGLAIDTAPSEYNYQAPDEDDLA